MADIWDKDSTKMLVAALLSLETEEECRAFLEDLLTTKETLDISQRIMVADMLSGQTVYTKIAEQTGASTATISRVNHCILWGAGGYQNVLKKIRKKD